MHIIPSEELDDLYLRQESKRILLYDGTKAPAVEHGHAVVP